MPRCSSGSFAGTAPGIIPLWRAAHVATAALFWLVPATEVCQIYQMAELQGTVQGQGGSVPGSSRHPGCAWLIRPGMRLDSIQFSFISAQFVNEDDLSFYSSLNLKARFSAARQIPEQVILKHSHEVLMVLGATSNLTKFHLEYTCKPSGLKLGSHYLTPIAYFSVLVMLVLLGILCCFVPAYIMYYCRAMRRLEHALQRSQLVLRSELRRQHAEEQQQAHSYLVEQRAAGALQALPIDKWHSPSTADSEECCLCLEMFQEEDELRMLPCSHYFHKTCVDSWFATRRYMPRSCPLCKRNPIASIQDPVLINISNSDPDGLEGHGLVADTEDTSNGPARTSSPIETSSPSSQPPPVPPTVFGRNPVAEEDGTSEGDIGGGTSEGLPGCVPQDSR